MRKIIVVLVMTAGVVFAEGLSLEQCIEMALKKSPEIVTLSNQYAAERARVKETRAVFLPRVTASFSATRQITPTASTFGPAAALMGIGPELDTSSYSLGLVASQNIWDFGKSVALETQVCLNEELAALQLEKKKKEVSYNVKKEFYFLLQAKGLEQASKLTLNDLKHLLESVKARKEQGVATKIDVMNAEVEALKFELEAKKAVNRVELASSSLKNLLVKNEEEKLVLAQDKPAIPGEIPLGLKSYEEARTRALAARIDFKELKLKEKISGAVAAGAYAEFWPTITGQAGYQYTGSDLLLKDKSWNLGLNVSVPLFSGFSRDARVEQAELALKSTASAEKLMEQAVSLQVRNNYIKIKETKQDYELAIVKFDYLKKNLEAINAKYDQGLSTLTELIDAQTKKSSAELENLQALYAYHTALNELEYSLGGK